jgi:hypothetical protein
LSADVAADAGRAVASRVAALVVVTAREARSALRDMVNSFVSGDATDRRHQKGLL